MTDNEIIKALKCCVSEQYTCEQCPYQEIKHYDYDEGFEIMPNGKQYDDWSCERWLMVDLLGLINRQKAEIERLKRYNADVAFKHYNDGKFEAIKEFAKKLKTRKYQSAEWSHGGHPYVVEEDDIDDVLEEMGCAD